jgi:hypothetical protein
MSTPRYDEIHEKAQSQIQDAVTVLEKSVNSTLVTPRMISKAFLTLHPYLLNEVLLGILLSAAQREGDGRVNHRIITFAKELWGLD